MIELLALAFYTICVVNACKRFVAGPVRLRWALGAGFLALVTLLA